MLFALLAWATGATADVYINATNFPSENFRQWVSDNCDLDHNGSLSNFELGQVTNVSLGIEQKPMYTLQGIEYFTDLMFLYCYECALTSLDVSNNPKLRNLDCSGNHLTTLDLSNNPDLRTLKCSYNDLTTLDLSSNTKLGTVQCFNNEIKGAGMTALISHLPQRSGNLVVIAPYISSEGNVMTTSQVANASSKGWKVKQWTGKSSSLYLTADILDYEGTNGATPYKLLIAGVRVTDDNKNDLSSLDFVQKGTITFDGSTLTLNDVTINIKDNDSYGLDIGTDGITVETLGTSLIYADTTCVCIRDNATFTGSGRFGFLSRKANSIYVFDEDRTKTTTLTFNDMTYAQATGLLGGIYSKDNDDCVDIKGIMTVVTAQARGGISFGNFHSINTYNGLTLCEPKGATISEGTVVSSNGTAVAWDMVTFARGLVVRKSCVPDDAFREYLTQYDIDQNYVLNINELTLKELYVNNLGIADLTGIEYFTSLKTLNCSNNEIAELDLTKNTRLTNVDCTSNQLTSLTLSPNSPLSSLSCAHNRLNGPAMDALIACLPVTTNGTFNATAPLFSTEQNVLTEEQIINAWKKGWNTYYWNAMNWNTGNYVPYPIALPTGVDNISADTTADSPFFTLDGRRINGKPNQRGLYIRNGKKVVVK